MLPTEPEPESYEVARMLEGWGEMPVPAPPPPQWGWAIAQDAEGEPHFVPMMDMWAHAWVDCRCQPVYDGVGMIHSAFDGREGYEQGWRKRH